MSYEKPLPSPTHITEPFWQGTKRHELLIQHCKDCQHYIFYPRSHCPQCLSAALEWKKSSGRGKVYSYTVIRRAGLPGFAKEVPYVFAIIELEEGPRLTSNIVGCKPEEVKIDMPVAAFFEEATPEVTLVKFKPT
jgi:uncharacterized OB-fold protein